MPNEKEMSALTPEDIAELKDAGPHPFVEKVNALLAAAEARGMERAAKIADAHVPQHIWDDDDEIAESTAIRIAEAIRALKDKQG